MKNDVLTAEVLVASIGATDSGWTAVAGGKAVVLCWLSGVEGDTAALVDEQALHDGEAVEVVAEIDSTTTVESGWTARGTM